MAIAAKSKLLVSVLAAVLALAAMGIFTMSPARASEAQVATWTALKAAVEGNTGDITIALTADLYADETVTISSGKNVTLTGGHTIYRKTGAESFLSSFKVEQGGTLNMGTAGSAANQCVNMSGLLLSRTWEMKPAKALTDMKPNDGRQFVILSPEPNNNALFFFDKHSERIKDFSLPSYNLEPTDSATITEADFWQISRTLLEVKEQNTNSGSLWGGWGHKLYNPTTGKYFALDSNKAFYGYGVSEPDRAGYDYWFNTQVDRNYWYLRDNQRHNTYVNFNFDANLGYNIVEGQVWNNSLRLVHLREMVEKERELLPHKYAAEELGVDQTTKGGFFINNEGGTVNVSCGTFSDFTTDELPTPKQIGWEKDAEVEGDDWSVAPGHIAPIYNSGSSAQFTMTGGTITKNIVGMNDRRDSNKCRMPLGEDGYLTYEDVRAMAIADGDADQALTRLGRKDWEFKASGNPCLMNFGTRSAGALILNEGAKGRIEGAALIDDNKGDAGAIIVHKSTLSLNDGAKITNNSGLYLGGAINVNSIDGMGVTMNGGEIAFNHSALEGAVTAHGPAGVTGGTFVMNGGSIHDNDTLDKGGAIRVASNGVQLNNGDIYNNRSWVMGGAIYVNGDTPRNSRTLVVNNGSIHDNHAVGSPSDTFVEGSGGAYADKTVDALKTPDDSKVFNYATKHGFEPGTGGGTWICPFGTLIFDGANVVIDDNSASNTGTDFFKETGLGGVLVPVNLAGWLNEETGAPPADNTTIAGQISLLNADEGARSSKGVKIHNNTSRRGGGIGGNGTLLFGTSADQEREHASLDFEKKFADGVEPPAEPLQFKMKTRASDGFVTEVGAFKLPTEAGSWKIHLEIPTDVVRADGVKERLIPADLNNGDEVQGFNDRFLIEEVNADGTRRSDYDFALGKVTVTRTETTTQNTTSTDASGATHSTTITFKDTQLAQTATNTKPKETRPTPAEVVLKAGKVLQDSGASGEEDATAEYRNKFIFELKEKLANGSTVLVSTAKNALDEGATVAFPAITYTAEGEHTYLVSEVKGSLNGIIYSKAVYEVKVNVVKENGTLKATVTGADGSVLPDNKVGTFQNRKDGERPALEKYVDKGVHSDLAAFDAPFEYDIMAYVPVDADRVVVEDSLVDSLKFVSSADEVSAFAMGAENNHLDTVKNDGTKIDSATAGIDGQKLTVTIPDATAYRGQWVRVNFRAVIDAATRATIESFGADWAEIAANAPVLIDAKHAGVKNAASYRVFVKNPDGTFPQYPSGENPGDPNGGGDKPKYEGESNTVTVTPPTQELAVAKAWANADGSSTWPADVASVTLDVYSVKDGAETKVEGRSAILTAGEPAKTLAGLPKLEGVEYIVKESGAESGEVLLNGKTYTVTVSGSTVTNTEKPTTPDTPGGDEPNNPGGDEPNNPGGDEPNNPGGDKPNTPGDGGLAKTGFALGGVSLLTGGMLLLGTALLGAKRRREG